MITAPHVLVAFAAFCLWLASLWVHPFGRCPRCYGRRMITKNKPGKTKPGGKPPKPPRPVRCWLCKGVGRRQRPGSRTLHRTARRIRRELDRQRKQRQAAAATEER